MEQPKNYGKSLKKQYIPPKCGGHKAIIKEVRIQYDNNGRKQIVVRIDFDSNDYQPNYFENEYMNDTRNPKTWPYSAEKTIYETDENGESNETYEKFINAWERSNGKKNVWGPDDVWRMQFKNGKIGVVFFDKEVWKNDRIIVRHNIYYFCCYDDALNRPVPELIKYVGDMGTQTNVLPESTDFMTIPEGFDDGLPFN